LKEYTSGGTLEKQILIIFSPVNVSRSHCTLAVLKEKVQPGENNKKNQLQVLRIHFSRLTLSLGLF
jgi:hypothetical protein